MQTNEQQKGGFQQGTTNDTAKAHAGKSRDGEGNTGTEDGKKGNGGVEGKTEERKPGGLPRKCGKGGEPQTRGPSKEAGKKRGASKNQGCWGTET